MAVIGMQKPRRFEPVRTSDPVGWPAQNNLWLAPALPEMFQELMLPLVVSLPSLEVGLVTLRGGGELYL